MKSIHRRIVVGVSAAALVAGASIASIANASVTGPTAGDADSTVRLLVGLRTGVQADVRLPSLDRLGLAGADGKGDPLGRRLLSQIRAKSVEVPAGRATAVTTALKLDPNVAYVQADPVAKKLDVTPNDPLFTAGRQPELAQLKVPSAWDTTTGAEVTVAVLDTGVTAYSTSDLHGKLLPGYDFVNDDNSPTDDEGHGTMVSSLIAATPDNGVGMAGVCAKCRILPVKVLDGQGSGSHSEIAQGILYATQQGAKIINLSLGGYAGSAVLQNAVAWANARGVLVVAAAGNNGNNRVVYPAAYPDVLAVGATDTRTGGTTRADFSSYGPWVDVAAPGITAAMNRYGQYCFDGDRTCWVTVRDRYGRIVYDDYEVQGTSFSSPLVAGVAALVASKNPGYTGWSLQRAVVASARKDASWTQHGSVNAATALTAGTDTTAPTVTGISPAEWARVRGNAAITPTGLTDNWSGIRSVEIIADGKWHSWDIAAPFAPVLNTAGRNGTINVQLRITDKAGNQRLTGVRKLWADNIAPTASIISAPANGAKVSGVVTTTVKAADASGISQVQLLVNGGVVATDTTAAYQLAFNTANRAKTLKVQARVYDRAGNVTYTPIRTYTRS
ncbi:S8 family serine peptidase [Actinoplanes utahensis]|uniref:S8 family serine peptidase n=1 Tax=Actinoplanes utahensis TaxID=1869 RepID=UPI00068E2F19|nr:S8 family serine peptidase [Actinoplanes utahensis]GIF27950.1 hypothetical protein Aut01nite_09360 [Actinoplanes utahensis]